MAKRQKRYVPKTRLSWAQCDRNALRRVIELCDGHTILKPEAFVQCGAPPALVAQHTQCFESNLQCAKETIFVDGKPVNQLVGVYGLDVIEQINDDLGLESPWQTGRGFRARQCYENIVNHLNDAEEVNDA